MNAPQQPTQPALFTNDSSTSRALPYIYTALAAVAASYCIDSCRARPDYGVLPAGESLGADGLPLLATFPSVTSTWKTYDKAFFDAHTEISISPFNYKRASAASRNADQVFMALAAEGQSYHALYDAADDLAKLKYALMLRHIARQEFDLAGSGLATSNPELHDAIQRLEAVATENLVVAYGDHQTHSRDNDARPLAKSTPPPDLQ